MSGEELGGGEGLGEGEPPAGEGGGGEGMAGKCGGLRVRGAQRASLAGGASRACEATTGRGAGAAPATGATGRRSYRAALGGDGAREG
eukprot:gene2236-4192_t